MDRSDQLYELDCVCVWCISKYDLRNLDVKNNVAREDILGSVAGPRIHTKAASVQQSRSHSPHITVALNSTQCLPSLYLLCSPPNRLVLKPRIFHEVEHQNSQNAKTAPIAGAGAEAFASRNEIVYKALQAE